MNTIHRPVLTLPLTLNMHTQEEGWLALWKGNLSATYLWITYAIVQFSVYGFLKRLSENIIDKENESHSNTVAGFDADRGAAAQHDKKSSNAYCARLLWSHSLHTFLHACMHIQMYVYENIHKP